MTGPPYPHPTFAPGSNAIGTFQIGISPVGTIEAFDLWVTVISQYANSPKLTAMIQSFNDAVDPTQDLENFFDMIWNVLTATGYGLNVWGRIVGVAREVQIPGVATGPYLGFGEASSWVGFGQGIFFSGLTGGILQNLSLSDSDYRRLILAKALSNITDGSIPSVNKILLAMFPNRGNPHVVDGLNMTLTYTFDFSLSPIDLAIIQQSGILPTAAGVVANISSM